MKRMSPLTESPYEIPDLFPILKQLKSKIINLPQSIFPSAAISSNHENVESDDSKVNERTINENSHLGFKQGDMHSEIVVKPKRFFQKPLENGLTQNVNITNSIKVKNSLSESTNELPIRFMWDYLDEKELHFVSESIKSLDGFLSTDCNAFDEVADGLIIGYLKASQKVLCTIASGKFIVNLKYIQDSNKKRKLLPVDKYLVKPNAKMKECEKELSRAALYWFNKMKRVPDGKPFEKTGLFYIIVESFSSSEEKERNYYELLIRSGGGQLTQHVENATFILTNASPEDQTKGVHAEYEKLNPYAPIEHVSMLEKWILTPQY